MHKKLVFLVAFIVLGGIIQGQISYLGMTFDFQDGVYGLGGPCSICASPDERFIYVSSQRKITYFSYDSITQELSFMGTYTNLNNGIEGLESNSTIRISPDGRHLYSTSYWLNCVTLFNITEESGELEYVSSFYDEENGNEGLRGVEGMEISSDGMKIYFAAHNDKMISVYQREPISGSISHLQSIWEYDPGGLSWPDALALSKDEKSLFVNDHMGDRLGVYMVDESSGLLTHHQTIESIDRLWSPAAVAVSHDNKFVYMLCRSALIIFERNPGDQTLSHHTTFHESDDNIPGLRASYSLAVSNSDEHIYVISSEIPSFVTFSRDMLLNTFTHQQSIGLPYPHEITAAHTTTGLLYFDSLLLGTAYWPCRIHIAEHNESNGQLTYRENIKNGQGASVVGLHNPKHCVLDPDSEYAFVTAYINSLVMLQRNDTNGWLTYKSYYTDSIMGQYFKYYDKTIISPNGKFAYVLGSHGTKDQIHFFNIDRQSNSLIYLDSIDGGPNGIPDLSHADDFLFTPDARYVYVVRGGSGAILQFSHDSISGYLDHIRTTIMWEECYSPERLCISKDGKYLVVSGSNSSDIAMYKINEENGEISLLANHTDAYINDIRLTGLEDIAISSDNKNIYAVYKGTNAIANFSIDTEADTFRLMQFMHYPEYPFDGLQGVERIIVKNDGTFVFTSSQQNHSFGFFYRSQDDGRLTFVHDYTEEQWGFNGLDGITWMSLSNDDRNLYICSHVEESISTYKIDLYLGPDLDICDGDTITLDAGQAYVFYQWSTGESSRQIKVSEEGWYIVETIDYFGFEDIDSIYITVHSLPQFDLGEDYYICEGDSILLSIPVYEHILWSTGAISNEIWAKDSGTYTVTATNTSDCSYIDEVDVIYSIPPDINLGNDTILSYDQGITLHANDNDNFSYLWFDGSIGKSIHIEPKPAYNNHLTAWVEVINEHGCVAHDSILITWDEDLLPPDPYIDLKPNPTRGDIRIESNYPITRIDCYSINGSYVFSEDCYGDILSYNLENLVRGMYFFRIHLSNGYSQTLKVIRL